MRTVSVLLWLILILVLAGLVAVLADLRLDVLS